MDVSSISSQPDISEKTIDVATVPELPNSVLVKEVTSQIETHDLMPMDLWLAVAARVGLGYTRAELEEYTEQCERTEGFGVTSSYGRKLIGGIFPEDPDDDDVDGAAKFSIREHNSKLHAEPNDISKLLFLLVIMLLEKWDTLANEYRSAIWRRLMEIRWKNRSIRGGTVSY